MAGIGARRPGENRPIVTDPGHSPPAGLRIALRASGSIGWVWIVAQGIAGGTSDADVATLFLWVYGWVGVAHLSALRRARSGTGSTRSRRSTTSAPGPASARRSRLGAAALSRRGSGAGRRSSGFVFFVWLELVAAGRAARSFIVLVGYTALHAGDDGPVRPRRVARARRDVHASGSGCSGRLAPFALGRPRTGARPPTAVRDGCSSRAGRDADIVLSPSGRARSSSTGCRRRSLVRPLRGAGRRRSRRSCSGVPRAHRRRGARP